MNNRLVAAYENEFSSLKSLPNDAKEKVIEIVFAYRIGVESITLISDDPHTIAKLADYLPEEFFEKASKYAIDLESIGSNKVRIYRSLNDGNNIMKGYYIENEKVYETKIYKRTEDRGLILVDRYDEVGNLISANEAEVRAKPEDWKGSSLVPKIAAENNFFANYLKKRDKDQCYVRVRIIT